MKSTLILAFTLIASFTQAQTQSASKIKWTVAGKRTSATTAEVYFKATLAPTWHIWSQTPGDDMLIPPTWTFDDKSIKAVGTAKEIGKKITKTEEGFKGKLTFYEGTVVFVQKIQIGKQKAAAGVINYQICDPKSCLPPTDFKFSVNFK